MAKVKLEKMLNIEEEQFPSNSKASRKEDLSNIRIVGDAEEKVTFTPKPVKAIKRRKSITRTIKQSLFSEDTRSVIEFVISDVLVPAAKSLISDIFTQGIQMMLFGEGGGPKRSRDRMDRTFVNYNDHYQSRNSAPVRSARTDRFGLEDIYFSKSKEANDVLESMCELLEKYDQVSVQDYFDLAGIDETTHVHAKWGWTSMKKAYCTYTPEGYAIVMPRPMELD